MGRALSALVFIGFVFALTLAAQRFYSEFAGSWGWHEHLLNYQGGLIKRALAGELALRLSSLVPPKEFIVALVTTSYIATIALMTMYFHLPLRLAGMLFLFSPGGMLFPLFDASAFGRKDIYCAVALGLGLVIATELRRPAAVLAALFAVYLVVGLMTEAAWFYMPLVVAAWLWARQDELSAVSRLICGGAAAVYVLVCLGVSMLVSSHPDAASMLRPWEVLYPGQMPAELGPLCYLSISIDQALGFAARQWAAGTNYPLGAALTLIPLLVLVFSARAILSPPKALTSLIGLGALVSGLAPIVLAADWGRYIYLLNMHLFMCLWFVIFRPSPAQAAWSARSWASPLAVVAVVAYALSWKMFHYVPEGRQAVIPGPLFGLF